VKQVMSFLFFPPSAGYQTQSLMHARQALYQQLCLDYLTEKLMLQMWLRYDAELDKRVNSKLSKM
jgi:hypothetical protein